MSLRRQIFFLSAWPLLEQVLSFLVTFVDTVQAGHVSASAVAAIGFSGYMIWVIGMVQAAVSVGPGAIIARASGASDRRLVNATLGQALVVSALAGIVMGTALFLSAPAVSRFVELRGAELDHSVVFLRILSFATPVSFVLFAGCACCRSAGDAITPFRTMLLVNVVNVMANVAFVLGPAPLGGHGVAGIAAATGLAWVVGAVFLAVVLMRGRHGMRLYVHRLILQRNLVWRFIRAGVPNLAEVSGIWLAQLLVVKTISHVGTPDLPNALALHSVAVRIEGISYLPGIAFGAAAATLAGQYLGIGDQATAQKAVKLCWSVCAAVMGCMGLMFVVIPQTLVAIVTDNATIARDAPALLRICGPSEIFMATYLVLSQAMRGAGDTRTALFLSYFSILCIRLPAVLVLGVWLDYGLTGIWFGLCGEVAFRGLLFAFWFRRGHWLRAKV